MSEDVIINIISDSVSTLITVVAPLLAIAMLVGILIALFQATTQINEQTMVFVPKIIAVFAGLMLLGGWMITQLREFTLNLFESILTFL